MPDQARMTTTEARSLATEVLRAFGNNVRSIMDAAGCRCVDCVADYRRQITDAAYSLMAGLGPIVSDRDDDGGVTWPYSDSLMQDARTSARLSPVVSNEVHLWISETLCASAIRAHNNPDWQDTACADSLASRVTDAYWPPRSTDDEDEDYNSEGPDEGDLYSYGTDVLETLGVERPGDELVFGVELEMECQSVRKSMQAIGGAKGPDYICKSDGSLNNGAELVTLPFTLDHHSRSFAWADLSKKLIASGATSGTTSTCGIHVHANKAALTPLQIGKMLVLLNAESNARFVEMVAQRGSNGYAQRRPKKIKQGKYLSDNRYDVLNVGRYTVEFRLFKGNLRPERILKNLEFCHAVITYCATASMQELDVVWFANFLRKNRGTYPNLCRFLQERNDPRFAGMFKPNARVAEVAAAEEV